MIQRKIIIFFALFILFSCSHQQEAKWITSNQDSSQPNQWICFRKNFIVNEVNPKEIASIAVDSRYWLWINDSLAVKEAGLSRNPNPNDTYVDKFDLAPFLKKGENTIAILINYFGRNGLNHNSSGMAGLYFDSRPVKSDASWKVSQHPAISDGFANRTNYRFAESNMVFKAYKDSNWTSETFNDKHWLPAKEIGPPPVAPWNKLIERSIPMHKLFPPAAYEKQERKGDTLICYLPNDKQVYPYFKIRSSEKEKITIFSDTYSLNNKRHHNSLLFQYVSRDGLQEYETFRWISGHKIYYIIPEEIDIIEVGYRESGYNTSFSSSFECDDPFLNKLWEKSRRTLYVNMRDHFMDCPDRERSQYAGDAGNTMMQVFYAFDTRAHLLNKKLFTDYFNWQRSDSTFYMPYGGWFSEELPLQNLYLTGYYGIYQYFLHTADTATIRKAYPSIKKYHALWKFNDRGLVNQRKGEWYWVDWGANKDERLLDVVLYACALKGDIELAIILGEDDDRRLFEEQYQLLKNSINKHYWQNREYRSDNYTGKTDDRGNALAVLAGVADEDKYEAISQILMENFHASPYMERFVLEALFTMNRSDLAIGRLKTRYRGMVESEVSTLWENWDESVGSYNHAWSGSPLHLLPQYIAGIKPLTPGFSRFEVIPNMDSLRFIHCKITTSNGNIEVNIDHEEWQFLFELYIPPSTSALVGIPKRYFKNTLKINGIIIKDNIGRKERWDEVQNVKLSHENDTYFFFDIQEGKWLIEAF